MLEWLGRGDAPLLFGLRADMRQWLWGLQFLRECTPARMRRNIEQIVRLGTYSRAVLQQLRADRGIAYDQRTQGILHFYTRQKEFDGAEAPAAHMRALGCDRRVISGDEAERIEPVLAPIRAQLAGATYTSEDESGDANRFARELFLRRREDGVQFLMNHTATAVCEAGGAIDHVEATDREGRLQRLRADAYVLAMGSLSSLFAAPLGIRLPIDPAKGHLVTMPVKDAHRAHQVLPTDAEYKLLFSTLTSNGAPGCDRLRIAGTAELNLETAVGRAQAGCDAVRWQGQAQACPALGLGWTLRARAREAVPGEGPSLWLGAACKEEQRGQRATAGLNRARSAYPSGYGRREQRGQCPCGVASGGERSSAASGAVFHAMRHIEPRLCRPGVVANPRDTYGYRCGLRLARTTNPSVFLSAAQRRTLHWVEPQRPRFEPRALRGHHAPRRGTFPRRRRHGAGPVLDRPAPRDAEQPAHRRPLQARQPVHQHRPRHAPLDVLVGLWQEHPRIVSGLAPEVDFAFSGFDRGAAKIVSRAALA